LSTPNDEQVAAGRKFASRVCGACHVVTQQRDELPVLAQPGPSFAVLAQRPLLTETSLREFLGSNHRDAEPAPGRLSDRRDRRVHDVAESAELGNN